MKATARKSTALAPRTWSLTSSIPAPANDSGPSESCCEKEDSLSSTEVDPLKESSDPEASSEDEEVDEIEIAEELEEFAIYFRQRRTQLGFTQGQVAKSMEELYANEFSQTTISRFEALQLTISNMLSIRAVLEKWLEDVVKVKQNPGEVTPIVKPPGKRRRKRTVLDRATTQVLENKFDENPRPSTNELAAIAEELDLEKEVVRVWFCNRRQKTKATTN